jgi:hypothetical protein
LGSGGGPLVFLYNDNNDLRFLADTGASCSVLPFSSSAPSCGPNLYAASGKQIAIWGTRQLSLSFGGHSFQHTFILAAVDKPILGSDFLAAHKLLVDPFNRAVLFASSLVSLCSGKAARSSPFIAALQGQSEQARNLLVDFPGILPQPGKHFSPLHGTEHSIDTTRRPVFAKARRLSSCLCHLG